jgi:hypothetical protein
VKVPGVFDTGGLTASQSPPESVEADALNANTADEFTENDWADGGLPPIANKNESEDGLTDRIGL